MVQKVSNSEKKKDLHIVLIVFI